MSTATLLLFRQAIKFQSVRRIHLTSRIFQDRFYTKKHEWVQQINNSNEVRIGISDFAQNALGDVVYCDLPAIGSKFQRDQTFATLESVKAVADCFMPVDGEVTQVNEQLKSQADLINKSPYENGWLVQAKVVDASSKTLGAALMNESKYQEYLEKHKNEKDH